MAHRHSSRLSVLCLLAGALATLVVTTTPAVGSPTPAGSANSIFVNATGDYGYTPDTIQNVPTNTTITVTFGDLSDMDHSFTIIGRQGWVIPQTYSTAQIDTLAYGKSPRALLNLNVTPGGVNVSSFPSPGPGWYEFVCTVSGHFQNGMYGFIAFGISLPSNLTTPSRSGLGANLSFSPIDAIVIVVLLAAAALIYLEWRRRREAERRHPRDPRRARGRARDPNKPNDGTGNRLQ